MSKNLPVKAPPTQPPAAAPASRPQWLDAWQPSHRITSVTRGQVKAELEKWEPVTIPADPKQVAILLEQTLAIYGAPDNWSETAEFYLEALEDVPIDLVEQALKHVRLNLKWFPKPSELREPIREELAQRKTTVSRLEAMLKLGDFEEPRPETSAEDRAKTLKLIADTKAALTAAPDLLLDRPKRKAG